MTMSLRLRAFVAATTAVLALTACSSDDPVSPAAKGSLAVTIAGLPSGTNASVTVAGPNAFSQVLTATQTLSVDPGSYTVTAAQVTQGTTRYNATVTGSPASVASSATRHGHGRLRRGDEPHGRAERFDRRQPHVDAPTPTTSSAASCT